MLVTPRPAAYRRYAYGLMVVNTRDMPYMSYMSREPIYPVKKLVNLTEEQAQQISTFRFDNRIASENEAIRRLIELGLSAGPRDEQ